MELEETRGRSLLCCGGDQPHLHQPAGGGAAEPAGLLGGVGTSERVEELTRAADRVVQNQLLQQRRRSLMTLMTPSSSGDSGPTGA